MILSMARCLHHQAEPVVLLTGETVACVCIACLAPLPADHIDRQRQRALTVALCPHDNVQELRALESNEPYEICNDCDPFLLDLVDAMTQPIRNPNAASSVVPIVLNPPATD